MVARVSYFIEPSWLHQQMARLAECPRPGASSKLTTTRQALSISACRACSPSTWLLHHSIQSLYSHHLHPPGSRPPSPTPSPSPTLSHQALQGGPPLMGHLLDITHFVPHDTVFDAHFDSPAWPMYCGHLLFLPWLEFPFLIQPTPHFLFSSWLLKHTLIQLFSDIQHSLPSSWLVVRPLP